MTSAQSTTTHEPAALAAVGARFRPSDNWRCRCGREHQFSAYAAAHWDEELDHTCDCGAILTFVSGRVAALYQNQTRNLNATTEAVVATIIWGDLYEGFKGGAMDFWDWLSEADHRKCELIVKTVREHQSS